jgi:membrane protein
VADGGRPSFLSLLRVSGGKWAADRAPRMAAALAYYTLVSMAPVLVVLTGLLTRLGGEGVLVSQILAAVARLAGPDAATLLEEIVNTSCRAPSSPLVTTITIAAALFGASAVFYFLNETLNLIWPGPPPQKWTLRAYLAGRLLAFAVLLIAGLLLVVYALAMAMLPVILGVLEQAGLGPILQDLGLLQLAQAGVGFVIAGVLFGLLFMIIPRATIHPGDVWLGAAVTSFLFVLGTFVISLYFRLAAPASVYGAAGAAVVLLLFAYYAAQIFYFGAEFTYVFSHRQKEAGSEE